MANQALFTPNRALDANAYAQPGATATFYQSGTMTTIPLYADEGEVIPLANPITADASGIFPQVFFNGDAKAIVRDADGATLWTIDPVPTSSKDAVGAAAVSFAPTATIPQTNVQDAIEALSVAQPGLNLIINGSGRVNQRGYVSGTATTGANQYTLDRWRVVVSGQNLTFTGNASGRTMTAPAGGAETVIEDSSIAGGTYVINWTGTATCTVNGVARAKGESFTLAANTAVTVRFTGGTFTEARLERGTISNPFAVPPIADEVARCQRYWCTTVANARFTATAGSETVDTSIYWPVRMRIAPIVSRTGTVVNCTATITSIGIDGARFSIQATASGDARAIDNVIFADAEL